MRVARYHANQDIRIEEIEGPKVIPGKAIVDVAWCGICGSDLHEYLIGPTSFGKEPHPLTGVQLPVTFGHEFCGVVRNPSSESGLKDGDAVMVDPRILCRECHPCTTGVTYGCEKLAFHGYHAGGGFAEQALVDERMLLKLPDSISLDYAALLEPLAVVQHAVKMSGITIWKEQSILIIGGGPIGLALIIALTAHGAEDITVSEPTALRRKQVAEFAKLTLNPIEDDVVARCRELTDGQGVDIVFDCAGVPPGIETAFDALRIHGTYLNVAVWEQPMVVPMFKFLFKHITMKSALIYDEQDFAEVIQLMADGKFVGYEKLVTSRIKLEDVVEKGFKELIYNKDDHIKILVSTRI